MFGNLHWRRKLPINHTYFEFNLQLNLFGVRSIDGLWNKDLSWNRLKKYAMLYFKLSQLFSGFSSIVSSVVSQLEASRVDWTFSHLSRIDAKQFSCVPVGNPVAISTFFYRFSFQWCAPQMKIVKGCEGKWRELVLSRLQPCKVSMWYIMVYFSTYAVDFWIAFEYWEKDSAVVIRDGHIWLWSWRRSCDMVQQRCSTHLEHIACTIFAFVYYIHIYIYVDYIDTYLCVCLSVVSSLQFCAHLRAWWPMVWAFSHWNQEANSTTT